MGEFYLPKTNLRFTETKENWGRFSYIHQPYVALAVNSRHVIIHTGESKKNMFPNGASHGLSKNMHPQEQITPSKAHKKLHTVQWQSTIRQHGTQKEKNTSLVNRKMRESTVCLVLLGRLPQRGS